MISAYQNPFSPRAEVIARQAILRAGSLGMEHYGPAPVEISGNGERSRQRGGGKPIARPEASWGEIRSPKLHISYLLVSILVDMMPLTVSGICLQRAILPGINFVGSDVATFALENIAEQQGIPLSPRRTSVPLPRKRRLPISDMSARHPGLSPTVAADYHEAARVCLDRHHTSPTKFEVNNGDASIGAIVEWEVTSEREQSSRANYRETTEKGAYGCALAAVELTNGLVAVRRAENDTGADYYVAPAGTELNDLEEAIRLEVSGIDLGGKSDVKRRLKIKVDQAARGKSNLPAMAGIVGFYEKLIVLERVVTP